jgi:opacity protein-like surface antigen
VSTRWRVARTAIYTVLFCLFMPQAAQAASGPELSFRAGPAFPSGDFNQIAGPGAFISGMFLGRSNAPLAFGMEVGGSMGHSDRWQGTKYKITTIQVTPVFRLGLRLPNGGLFYLLGGAGYYLVDYQLSNAASHTEHDFGVNGGGGFLLRLSEHTRAGVEFRFHHLVEGGIQPNYFVPVVLITYAP